MDAAAIQLPMYPTDERARLRKPNGHDRPTNGVNIDIVKTEPPSSLPSPMLALFALQGVSCSTNQECEILILNLDANWNLLDRFSIADR